MIKSVNHSWAVGSKQRQKYGDTWADIDFYFPDKISKDRFRNDPMNCVVGTLHVARQDFKFKYKDWNIIGVDKKPIIKISIDGMLFESISHSIKTIGISEEEIRSKVFSRKEEWLHWTEVEPINHMSYREIELTWNKTPRMELHTVSCGGQTFINTKVAGEYLGISQTRVNQKIKSEKYPDFFRI